MAIVGGRMFEALDVANRIVAGVSHCAATKPRQPWHMRRAIIMQIFLQQLERIGAIEFELFPGAKVVDNDMPIPRLKNEKGVAAEKAIPPHAFAADDALEEKRPIAFFDFFECGNR